MDNNAFQEKVFENFKEASEERIVMREDIVEVATYQKSNGKRLDRVESRQWKVAAAIAFVMLATVYAKVMAG
jgi:hypothetical protein